MSVKLDKDVPRITEYLWHVDEYHPNSAVKRLAYVVGEMVWTSNSPECEIQADAVIRVLREFLEKDTLHYLPRYPVSGFREYSEEERKWLAEGVCEALLDKVEEHPTKEAV